MIGQRSMRPAATPETSSDILRGLADAATRPLQELLSLPHSSESGLSARDAASILETTGPNRIAPAPRKTVLADLLDRLGNPLALVLLFAATVSGFTGDASSFVIIRCRPRSAGSSDVTIWTSRSHDFTRRVTRRLQVRGSRLGRRPKSPGAFRLNWQCDVDWPYRRPGCSQRSNSRAQNLRR